MTSASDDTKPSKAGDDGTELITRDPNSGTSEDVDHGPIGEGEMSAEGEKSVVAENCEFTHILWLFTSPTETF